MLVGERRPRHVSARLGGHHNSLSGPRRRDGGRIGPTEVRARYGVDPAQVPDFIALRGDPSDKLPGAPGVGPAGAAALLRRYGTLESPRHGAGRYAALADTLRLYRSIATMNRKAPLPPLRNQPPTWAKASALARGLGARCAGGATGGSGAGRQGADYLITRCLPHRHGRACPGHPRLVLAAEDVDARHKAA